MQKTELAARTKIKYDGDVLKVFETPVQAEKEWEGLENLVKEGWDIKGVINTDTWARVIIQKKL